MNRAQFTRIAAAALALSLGYAAAQQTNSVPDSIAIGIEGQRTVVLSGEKLEAAPVGDKSKIILRVQDTFPHGDAHRYDLRYFGFVPGEYDLVQFLRTADGKTPTNLPPIHVTIHGILPEDHDGMLIEDDDSGLSLPGGYLTWLTGIGVIWLLAAWPLFFAGRKPSQALGQPEEDAGPDLAERLRPLVEQAAAGTLDTEGLARLERMIFSHWREQLDLPEQGDPVELHRRLKQHDDAGPLVRGLEDWLHRPPGTAAVDIAALLEPYRESAQPK